MPLDRVVVNGRPASEVLGPPNPDESPEPPQKSHPDAVVQAHNDPVVGPTYFGYTRINDRVGTDYYPPRCPAPYDWSRGEEPMKPAYDPWRVFQDLRFGELMAMSHDGKPVFEATQAARMLRFTNPERAIRQHCKGVTKSVTPTAGGAQTINFITLGDLIRLVVASGRDDTDALMDWVTEWVVPSIMVTGSYHETPQTPQVPQTLGEALMLAARQTLEVERLQGELREQTRRIETTREQVREEVLEEVKPAVDFYKHCRLRPNEERLIRDISTMRGMPGQYALFETLRANGHLLSAPCCRNQPRADLVRERLMGVRRHEFTHNSGRPGVSWTPVVIGQRGWDWIWRQCGHQGSPARSRSSVTISRMLGFTRC